MEKKKMKKSSSKLHANQKVKKKKQRENKVNSNRVLDRQ